MLTELDSDYLAVSLYSGAGGMDVGFERIGTHVAAAVERDPAACSTYIRNHHGTNVYEGEVSRFAGILRHKYSGVDIVFGGPPCQDYSPTRNVNPTSRDRKLGVQAAETVTFVETAISMRPKVIVMENVINLRSQ